MDVRMKWGRELCVHRVRSECLAYSRRSAILSTTIFLLFPQTRGISSAKNLFQCLSYNRWSREKKSLRKEFSGKKFLRKEWLVFALKWKIEPQTIKKQAGWCGEGWLHGCVATEGDALGLLCCYHLEILKNVCTGSYKLCSLSWIRERTLPSNIHCTLFPLSDLRDSLSLGSINSVGMSIWPSSGQGILL